jgi:hypothetical protein
LLVDGQRRTQQERASSRATRAGPDPPDAARRAA